MRGMRGMWGGNADNRGENAGNPRNGVGMRTIRVGMQGMEVGLWGTEWKFIKSNFRFFAEIEKKKKKDLKVVRKR